MLLPSPFLLKPHPSSFLHSTSIAFPKLVLPKPNAPFPPSPLPSSLTIHALKKLQGRVVKDQNDKTVAVEVVRLAPHPKYKRRIRIKKRYQAHDPDNQFKVGDFVQLEKSRPISKTKAFLAIPVITRARNSSKPQVDQLPLQSQQQQEEDKGEVVE